MKDKTENSRGYDDTHYLTEMAAGIVTRRFSSVDEAAKKVLGNSSSSNADRLRRKFREQKWYERGLNDYVEAELGRRQTVVESARTSDTPDTEVVMVSQFNIKRRLPLRKPQWLPLVATLALALIAPSLLMPVASLDASEDPIKVARRERAINYATDAYTALYDLDFNDPDARVYHNLRFFLTPGAFETYKVAVNGSGMLDNIRQGLLVLRNKVTSKPRATEWLDGYVVDFDVERTAHTAKDDPVSCYRVEVFTNSNPSSAMGQSEFGLLANPRIMEKTCP